VRLLPTLLVIVVLFVPSLAHAERPWIEIGVGFGNTARDWFGVGQTLPSILGSASGFRGALSFPVSPRLTLIASCRWMETDSALPRTSAFGGGTATWTHRDQLLLGEFAVRIGL